jgi:hypothetical protein
MNDMTQQDWPELDWNAWRDTAIGLQLRAQIVGKVRLARTPWLNHSWHVPFYLTARGWTTSAIPCGSRIVQIDFDLIGDAVTRPAMARPGRFRSPPAQSPTSMARSSWRSRRSASHRISTAAQARCPAIRLLPMTMSSALTTPMPSAISGAR